MWITSDLVVDISELFGEILRVAPAHREENAYNFMAHGGRDFPLATFYEPNTHTIVFYARPGTAPPDDPPPAMVVFQQLVDHLKTQGIERRVWRRSYPTPTRYCRFLSWD